MDFSIANFLLLVSCFFLHRYFVFHIISGNQLFIVYYLINPNLGRGGGGNFTGDICAKYGIHNLRQSPDIGKSQMGVFLISGFLVNRL